MSSMNASSVVKSGYGGSGQAAFAAGRSASANRNATIHAQERKTDETIWANMELLCRSLATWEVVFCVYDGLSPVSTFVETFVDPTLAERESTKDATKVSTKEPTK